MNKKDTAKAMKILAALVALGPDAVGYATQADITLVSGLTTPDNPFLMVNEAMRNPANANELGVKVTQAGYMASQGNGASAPTSDNASNAVATASAYEVMGAGLIELPKVTRGRGAGAGNKYPFDTLVVGGFFFVPNDADKPNAAKSLSSTINTANKRYATKTGEKTVTRTKRGEGNKAVKDAAGNNVKESATVPVYTFSREFKARPVKAGVAYGQWTAPADGAVVVRTA